MALCFHLSTWHSWVRLWGGVRKRDCVIKRIMEDGAVGAYNAKGPEVPLRIGDRIIRVNAQEVSTGDAIAVAASVGAMASLTLRQLAHKAMLTLTGVGFAMLTK